MGLILEEAMLRVSKFRRVSVPKERHLISNDLRLSAFICGFDQKRLIFEFRNPWLSQLNNQEAFSTTLNGSIAPLDSAKLGIRLALLFRARRAESILRSLLLLQKCAESKQGLHRHLGRLSG